MHTEKLFLKLDVAILAHVGSRVMGATIRSTLNIPVWNSWLGAFVRYNGRIKFIHDIDVRATANHPEEGASEFSYSWAFNDPLPFNEEDKLKILAALIAQPKILPKLRGTCQPTIDLPMPLWSGESGDVSLRVPLDLAGEWCKYLLCLDPNPVKSGEIWEYAIPRFLAYYESAQNITPTKFSTSEEAKLAFSGFQMVILDSQKRWGVGPSNEATC